VAIFRQLFGLSAGAAITLIATWLSAVPSAVANHPRSEVRWPWAARATRRATDRVLQRISDLWLTVTRRQARISFENVMAPATGSPIRIDQVRAWLVATAPLASAAPLLA
jgi:hypothetical protein